MVLIKYVGSWQPKEIKEVTEKQAKELVKNSCWEYFVKEEVTNFKKNKKTKKQFKVN